MLQLSVYTIWLFLLHITAYASKSPSVRILHLIDNANWGEVDGSALQGKFSCFPDDPTRECEVLSSDCKSNLVECIHTKAVQVTGNPSSSDVILALYHIHSWGALTTWPHAPNSCRIPSHYTMAESEESHGRFHKLFSASFATYDGNSTTHPHSSVQRIYFRGLDPKEFLPQKPFSQLIRGASFVASTCHRMEGTTKRVAVVSQMQAQYRVDSLGRCHTTRHIPEGIVLKSSTNALENLRLKQVAISHYLFYCAFENTYERGYVTEKVFDALIAGVVPIYLGPSEDCRPLLPHPRAAIFLDDFHNDVKQLVAYLKFLSGNESAYEEHRAWRKDFDPRKASPMVTKPWPCRICEWAVNKASHDPNFKIRDKRMRDYVSGNVTC